VVLAAALLATFEPGVPPPAEPATTAQKAPRVAVSKDGGSILFAIQNGSRSHTVHRSSDPRGSGAGTKVEVSDGAYVDSLQDQADLVFYRIE
jgi:hypothetical protein